MVYLTADGTLVEKRSPWRLSIVSDGIWAVVDFVWLFVMTLVSPGASPAPVSIWNSVEF